MARRKKKVKPSQAKVYEDNFRLGHAIREHREALGFSLQDLADRVGCVKSYLSMIENGIRGAGGAAISPDLLEKIEGALNVVPGTLMRLAEWSATPREVRGRVSSLEENQRGAAAELRSLVRAGAGGGAGLDEAYRSGKLGALIARLEGAAGESGAAALGTADGAAGPAARGAKPDDGRRLLPLQVPLINSVQAGYPVEFTDLGYPARVAAEYVRSPDIDDPDAFAARVVGDSMAPLYREGDIVVFSPARAVKSGMDCFVRLERDSEVTFKRVTFAEGSGSLMLVALNPKYGSREVDREDVAFLCAAVSVTRKIG